LSYALIHVLDPARAAQYAALVEQHRLAATPARTQDEALFHARRLGPASLLLIEVRAEADGFALLHRLRRARQTCPALIISGSWELRNEALRLRKKLGIAEVLAASQPLVTVEKAVARALGPQKQPRVEAEVPTFPELPARKPEPAPQGPILEELLGQTARSLHASMALAWLQDETLHGHFGWDTDLVPMVGTVEEWTPFRHLAASAPVDVRRCADDKVLSRSPLVISGTVGSFAGAPLVDKDGQNAGVLWVAQREPNGLVPDVLHPLTVWAQHIGSRLDELARKANRSFAPPPKSKEPRLRQSTLDVGLALSEMISGLKTGIIVTDADDRIAVSNSGVLRLLGLRNRKLTGLMRSRVVERLRLHSGLDGRSASKLLEPTDEPRHMEVALHVPAERILRWETRPLQVGLDLCRVDELADVTIEVEQREATEKLVRIDALTLLGNRRSFEESLAKEISRVHRVGTTLSLALFRIDNRERLKPGVADVVLRDVSWLIADITRGYDHAARIEEDSVAVILPGAPAQAAFRFANRIVEETAEVWLRHVPRVTLSGGIAEFDRAEDVSVLVTRARAALLEAAACGGNGVI
jgi:diguanylate cyclase (GGDEF)-like protein